MQTSVAEFVKWIALPLGLATLAMLAVAIYSGAHAQGICVDPAGAQAIHRAPPPDAGRSSTSCCEWEGVSS